MQDVKTIRMRVVLLAALAAFIFGVSDTCSGQLIPDMVSYWRFEDGAGSTTASDSVGTNHGTLVGDPVWITGQVGGALDFDDNYDYVLVPDAPSLNPGTGSFSVAAWVKPAYDHWSRVIWKQDHNGGYNIYFTGGGFTFELFHPVVGDQDNPEIGGDPCGGLVFGNWYHIVGVRDTAEGTAKFYVNGVERGVMVDTTLGLSISTPIDLDIGPSGDEAFFGAVDEVAIFSRALSGSEICGMYTNGLDGEGYTGVLAQPVVFGQTELKEAVEEALGITDPTQCDMLCLTWVEGSGRGIADLTGLEYARNLTEASLSNNQISDLTPISGLTNLTRLHLSFNQISDITPLSGLTNLDFLDLGVNQISIISAVSNLTNLTELWVSGGNNNISDISPLSGLTKLTGLGLGDNNVSDISVLSGLTNLTYLELGGNNISDISHISGLKSLEVLWLGGNLITDEDISDLVGLTNLVFLEIRYHEISDISALSALKDNLRELWVCYSPGVSITVLSELTNLEGLWLECNQINDIEPLSGLMNLQYLILWGNPLDWAAYCTYIPMILGNNPDLDLYIDENPYNCEEPPVPIYFADDALKAAVEEALGVINPNYIDMYDLYELEADNSGIADLTGLEYAKNLEKLVLPKNQIVDLTPLSGLINIKKLVLNDNQIDNLTCLSGLMNLEVLILSNNQICDIASLSGLLNLQKLEMGGNQISEINDLSGLTSLLSLELPENQIVNVSPLSGLTNLKKLNLHGNQISDVSYLAGLTNLKELILRLNQISDIGPLSGLTNLQTLWVNRNQIDNIEHLSGLMNLRELKLDHNPLSDITPLSVSDFTNLKMLTLGFNLITNIQSLSGLTNLTLLELPGNQISDIEPLRGLTYLQSLNLQGNQISDIEPISGLTSLEFLNLLWNPLNCEAYLTYIPAIKENNPGIDLRHFPTPPECLNQPPTATIIGPYSGLVEAVNVPVQLSGYIDDPDSGDTHTAVWTISNENWTEDLVIEGIILEPGNIVLNEKIFTEAGIYSIKLTVTDYFGESDETSIVNDDPESPAFVVIYNPDGGFVTGGGWIYSPAGALLYSTTAEGKASFGFVAKYKQGATVPSGNTEFRFQAGDFRFKSSSYEWLVVAGTKAMFKGEGSIDGMNGSFKFMLTAVDDTEDKFRIKIWDPATDDVIYDNKRGQGDEAEPTVIGGGSIVIHKQ